MPTTIITNKESLMMHIDCAIAQESDQWPELDFKHIEKTITATLKAAEFEEESSEYEISLLLTDDIGIQALNREYRDKDKPTNVLSFPQDDPFAAQAGILGDIILAYETIKREAIDHKKSFDDHLTHLIIHGTLHLIGYDHITENEAQIMEALEVKILSQFGIKNPYDFSENCEKLTEAC